MVLARNVARRANSCIFDIGPNARNLADYEPPMRLVRGPQPECRPDHRERVFLRPGRVLITTTHVVSRDSSETAYRACLLPSQPLRVIDTGFIATEGSSGGESTPALFTAAGTWLAWTDLGYTNDFGPYEPSITQINLAAPQSRPRTYSSTGTGADNTWGRVVQLKSGPGGVIAWVLDPTLDNTPPPPTPPAQLNVRRPGQPVRTIDESPAASSLADLEISPDGKTLNWTDDGHPRTSTIPG